MNGTLTINEQQMNAPPEIGVYPEGQWARRAVTGRTVDSRFAVQDVATAPRLEAFGRTRRRLLSHSHRNLDRFVPGCKIFDLLVRQGFGHRLLASSRFGVFHCSSF